MSMSLIHLLKVLPPSMDLTAAGPMVKLQHTSEHKITIPKGATTNPGTVLTQKRESTHMYPDAEAALKNIHPAPAVLPESGIGKDPRQVFEDTHWTADEKEGHRAYVESVQQDTKKDKVDLEGNSKSNMPPFWTSKERNPEADTHSVDKGLPAVPVKGKLTSRTLREVANLGENEEKDIVKASEVQNALDIVDELPKGGKVGNMASFWAKKEKELKSVPASPKDGISGQRIGKVGNVEDLSTDNEKGKAASGIEEGSNDAVADSSVGNLARYWTEKERMLSLKGGSLIGEPSQSRIPGKREKMTSEHFEALKAATSIDGPFQTPADRVPMQDSVEDSIDDARTIGKLPTWRLNQLQALLDPKARVQHDDKSDSSSISESPRLTHLTKNRARPPKNNRLLSGSHEV
jgi:hypothetical protein